MPQRDLLKVNLTLDRLHCYDEDDGWGNAEPYLWNVFFKIDGSTVTLTDSLTLGGSAYTETHSGSHGNLGDSDVDAGDDVSIPENIGRFDTNLSSIKGGILNALDTDLGGVVGVVSVLMEEDNLPNSAAEAGHAALNTAVQSALDQIVATRSISNQEVTDAEIASFTSEIQSAVTNAVTSSLGFFESIWAWVNPDDTIGTKVFLFKHDELAAGGTINFSQRWQNEGDWELFGHVTSSVLCPAGALDDLFSGKSSLKSMKGPGPMEKAEAVGPAHDVGGPQQDGAFDLAALRAFRDGDYRELKGLALWWSLADRNTTGIIRALLVNRELREPAQRLMTTLPGLVASRDARVPDGFYDDLEILAAGLRQTGDRRLRLDSRPVRSAIPRLRGKSFNEAAGILASLPPRSSKAMARRGSPPAP